MPRPKTVAGSKADPLVEYATLEIDGEEYSLAYDFNAIAVASKVAGCNLMHGIAAAMNYEMDAAQFRGLFYAGLTKAHPGITIEQAGALIRLDTMADIHNALIRAYNASLPEAKRFTKDPPEGAPAAPES